MEKCDKCDITNGPRLSLMCSTCMHREVARLETENEELRAIYKRYFYRDYKKKGG